MFVINISAVIAVAMIVVRVIGEPFPTSEKRDANCNKLVSNHCSQTSFVITSKHMHNDIVAEQITVNETSLYYEAKGRGLPIVFISGGGILDRRGWDEQFEFFSKYYRVIRYDVRGIGKSARPQTQFSHSEDLYALLTLLKIQRAHVVGLSVGGAIAIDFAISHPAMVDHLVLAASGLSSDSKSKENIQGLDALSTLMKTKGIEHLIQLTLNAPFVLSKENTAAREKVRQIYLENEDVFRSGFHSMYSGAQSNRHLKTD